MDIRATLKPCRCAPWAPHWILTFNRSDSGMPVYADSLGEAMDVARSYLSGN